MGSFWGRSHTHPVTLHYVPIQVEIISFKFIEIQREVGKHVLKHYVDIKMHYMFIIYRSLVLPEAKRACLFHVTEFLGFISLSGWISKNDHQITSPLMDIESREDEKWIRIRHPGNSNLMRVKTHLHWYIVSFTLHLFNNPLVMLFIIPWSSIYSVPKHSLYTNMPWELEMAHALHQNVPHLLMGACVSNLNDVLYLVLKPLTFMWFRPSQDPKCLKPSQVFLSWSV